MKNNIGIYNANMRLLGGGEKRTLAMADYLSRFYKVFLIVREPIDREFLEQFFGVDLSRVEVVVVGKAHKTDIARLNPTHGQTRSLADLVVRSHEYQAIRKLDLDLLINNSASSKMLCAAPLGIYMCMFPHRPESLDAAGPLKKLSCAGKDLLASRILGRHSHAYRSYSVITANSKFTAGWVARYWGTEAEVVYTVCDIVGPGDDKDKIILSVGRFSPDKINFHPKNQRLLLETFKQMTDLHRAGWQLHLAGSCLKDDLDTAEFITELRSAAQGYPIHFHLNVKRDDLHQLYRRSYLYWHATGYGNSENEYPHKQEHFGQTTVEAMSAGCVPVVINTGGQRETVQHGVNGLLWANLEELTLHTRLLIAQPERWQELSNAGIQISKRFSKDAFLERIGALTDRLLSTTSPRR